MEYADTKEAIKSFPYIKQSSLPVIINCLGGYTSFNLSYEKEHGFVEIIEIDENASPLTREQMYPKNSIKFEYGWISPEGDTYNTGYEGHSRSADIICEELRFHSCLGEMELENRSWIKITRSLGGGKAVFCKDNYITKKQADTLFDLGLWKLEHVLSMVHRSKNNW